MKRFHLVVLVLLVAGISASAGELKFSAVNQEVVRQRLMTLPKGDEAREQRIVELFKQAGCPDAQITIQPVSKKLGNVICVLPGATPYTIIVGGHYDYIPAGQGIVDNWSGASLLPSLYEAIATHPRQHTFIFVAFTEEEQGEIGSREYVKKMTQQDRDNMRAMVNLDTLGLGVTEVWYTHADPYMIAELSITAEAVQAPIRALSVDQVGSSDSEQFRLAGMPALTLHSLTTETLPILHNAKDSPDKIRFDDYYQSYQLISAYLAQLDLQSEPVWRVGKDVKEPKAISTPATAMGLLPAAEKKAAKHPVVASVVVGTDGHVSEVEIVQADTPAIMHAAEETLRQWTYKPGTKDGTPVPTRIEVHLSF